MPIVVDEDLFPVVWGDVTMTIALDQPASRRDLSAWVNDDFAVVAQIYVRDGDAEPLTEFTGRTLSMLIGYRPDTTVAGQIDPTSGQILFDLSDIDWSRYWGRTRFTIRMEEAGKQRTIAQGYIATYGNTNPCAWPNDYGFGPWGIN